MIALISFCSFPWWLAWLLPFLLGLLAAWAWMSKYKNQLSDLEGKYSSLQSKNSTLEADLATCQSRRAEVESDLALAKGRMREMEGELKDLKASGGNGGSVGAGIATGVTGSDEDVSIEINDGSNDGPKVASGIAAGAGMSGGETGGKSSAGNAIYTKLKSDNLQIIEGVGPKMESVLKENGISDWGALAGKSAEDLQKILDKYGDKYRIINPSTWSQQAALASQGKFPELITLQKNLDTGRDTNINQTDSKLEKVMVKLGLMKKYKPDDLKAVEGIGPKIESLLHDAGIKTWKALSETSPEKIQEILTKAGSRFSLADPGTWPKQAELAAAGKWSELKEYQDFLQGGK